MIRLFICLLLSSSLFAEPSTLERVESCLLEESCELFEALKSEGYVCIKGNDSFRSAFVSLQAVFEHVIACQLALKELDHSIGAIHTPTPATALCTSVDHAHESFHDNPDAMLTVSSRPQTIRSYLEEGGVLMSIYPKAGLEKRSLAQQAIYFSNVQGYPHNLIDVPMCCTSLPSDLIGATYLLTYPNGKQWLFSIQGVQQNAPKEEKEEVEWALWFGPLHDVRMLKRLCAIGQLLPVQSLFTAD